MKAEVYRNLHTGTWSVRDLRVGKVVDHPDNVVIRNAKFVVRPAGREKVRQEKRKNVHAFIKGDVLSTDFIAFDYSKWRKASYNPYVNNSFIDVETGNPIYEAYIVCMNINDGVYYLSNEKG